MLKHVDGLALSRGQRRKSALDVRLGDARVNPPVLFDLKVAHYFHIRCVQEVHPFNIKLYLCWKHLSQQGSQMPLGEVLALFLDKAEPFPEEAGQVGSRGALRKGVQRAKVRHLNLHKATLVVAPQHTP